MMRMKSLGRGAAALSLMTLLAIPARVEGATRKIEFPPEGTDRIIEAKVLPDQPVTAARKGGKDAGRARTPKERRYREAQILSVSDLFRRYNRSLTAQSGRQYAEYILQAGEQFKQEPFALAALIVHESSANAKAVSRGGDYGLMQVRWNVHKSNITKKYPHIKKAKDMFDPRYNVLIGTEIFARYRGNSDVKGGVLRYSAGNKKLAQKVLATMKELEKSYQKHLKALS